MCERPGYNKVHCTLLPQLPDTVQVIPLQFKRRLRYQSNYTFKHIRPSQVKDALRWLKHNNPLYKDVTISQNWDTCWAAEDPDLFQAMIGTTCNASSSGTAVSDTVTHDPKTSNAETPLSDPVTDDHPKTHSCDNQVPISVADEQLTMRDRCADVLGHTAAKPVDVNAHLSVPICPGPKSCSHMIPGHTGFLGDTPLEFQKEAFNLAHIVHNMGLAIFNLPSSDGSCLYAALSALLNSFSRPCVYRCIFDERESLILLAGKSIMG